MDTNSIPLILPRRHSISGNSYNQRNRQWSHQPYPPPTTNRDGTEFSLNKLATATTYSPHPKLPVIGRPREITFPTTTLTQNRSFPSAYDRARRRHSISSGSSWTVPPPKHALHMPIMKINPEVWRNESHQREIHRLLHEGREIEVMRRRNMGSVMDTSDGREDESEMKGVVSTMDLGGFKALEAREKRREQEEVMQEWSRAVNYTKEASRRRSWPNLVYPKPSVGLPVIQQQNGQPTNWIGQQGSIGTFPSMPTQFTQPRNLRRASFSGI